MWKRREKMERFQDTDVIETKKGADVKGHIGIIGV